ncbi:MAG: AAA family ATPase [Candidatus Woesearchaeota archaeon]
MIIHRPNEIKRIEGIKKWTLVYGRRKTGKSFLVENFVKYDEFFFVKKDRTIISKRDSGTINYDTFLSILARALEENKVVVVDEFQRLGDDFFDYLHSAKKTGRVILISSTLFLSKKLFSSNSALLGLFAEIPVGLISAEDCLVELKKLKLGKKQMLEAAILLGEPILIDFFEREKNARDILAVALISMIRSVPALIGEIFVEEEREISAVYEGILRAVASGKVVSGEISSYLFSRRLIKKDDPSVIQQYLNNLLSFGIINRVKVFNKKRFVYKHVSPLARLFYYADEKYNISERVVEEKEMREVIGSIMPHIVEDSVRGLIAKKEGLIETVFEAGDYDVDGVLLRFKKPEIAVEVKWKDIRKEDIAKAEESLERIQARRKVLFVQDKRGIKAGLEVMDVDDLC